MAQLRQDYQKYIERNTEVVVVGPEGQHQFLDYWTNNKLPFIGLPDPNHTVLKRYGQEINLFKFGRMPAQALIDKAGIVRFVHYGHSMSDIPSTNEFLELLDEINQAENASPGRRLV